MNSTTTSVTAFKEGDNRAIPHNEMDGKLRVIRYDNVDNAGPAASINSCVRDMAQWIRLQLGRGTFEGKKFFTPASSREMWNAQIAIPVSEASEKFNPTQHFSAYGLGWFLNDYQGRKVVSHGGGLDGMISRVALMPEENLGLVVLSNSETPLSTILVNKVFDVYLEVGKRDWSADYLARAKQAKAAGERAEKKLEDERAQGTRPHLALQGYAGAYAGDMYGEAKVAVENGKLVLRLVPAPAFVGDLEHWQHDTFRLKWRDSVSYAFPKGFVTFILNARGEVEEMKIEVPNPDFDFKELEFKRARDAHTSRSR